MNTTTPSTTRSTITRSTVTALVTIVALSGTAGTAVASTPRGPEGSQTRIATAPFAERIDALHGRSLAQYVAEHMERRLG